MIGSLKLDKDLIAVMEDNGKWKCSHSGYENELNSIFPPKGGAPDGMLPKGVMSVTKAAAFYRCPYKLTNPNRPEQYDFIIYEDVGQRGEKAIDWTEGMYGNKPKEPKPIQESSPRDLTEGMYERESPPKPAPLVESEESALPKTPTKLTPPKVKPSRIGSGPGREAIDEANELKDAESAKKTATEMYSIYGGDGNRLLASIRNYMEQLPFGSRVYNYWGRLEELLEAVEGLNLPPDTHPEIIADRREDLGLPRYPDQEKSLDKYPTKVLPPRNPQQPKPRKPGVSQATTQGQPQGQTTPPKQGTPPKQEAGGTPHQKPSKKDDKLHEQPNMEQAAQAQPLPSPTEQEAGEEGVGAPYDNWYDDWKQELDQREELQGEEDSEDYYARAGIQNPQVEADKLHAQENLQPHVPPKPTPPSKPLSNRPLQGKNIGEKLKNWKEGDELVEHIASHADQEVMIEYGEARRGVFDLWRELNDVIDNQIKEVFGDKTDPQDFDQSSHPLVQNSKAVQKIRAARRATYLRMQQTKVKAEETNVQATEALFKMLEGGERHDFLYQSKTKDQNIVNSYIEASDWLQKVWRKTPLVEGEELPSINVIDFDTMQKTVTDPKQRELLGRPSAKWDMNSKQVVLMPNSDSAAASHELGHMLIDYVAGVREACMEFLEHRMGNEESINLKEKFPYAGYIEREMGRKDKFDNYFDRQAAYYIGKVYTTEEGEVYQLELLSKLLEAAKRDLVGLCTDEPEGAKFLFGILSGQIRGEVKNRPVVEKQVAAEEPKLTPEQEFYRL